MELTFIGQGLDPDDEQSAGQYIIEAIDSGNYSAFSAFVAFVSVSGLKNIIDNLVSFKEKGGAIRIFLGVNLNATSKEALELLIENDIESYVIYSPNSVIYHPKVYIFEGDERTRAVIGSSNLTQSGLFQNIEASVGIDFLNADKTGAEFMTDLYDYYGTIINLEHKSCQLLTNAILDLLVDCKIVLSEKVNWEKNNKTSKEFKQVPSDSKNKLLSLFGKLNAKRPPKGYSKVISNEIPIIVKNEEVSISTSTTSLTSGSMWAETGKMTGGSRNILDLSKAGKRDGVVKVGSVDYFGIAPDDPNTSKSVDIHLGEKVYKDNPILFAESNSNWRIQLKGETIDGDKLTTISNPHLGLAAGFVDKILIFTKIDSDNFEMQIVDGDELEKFTENSSDWARSGRGGTGRAYGFIA